MDYMQETNDGIILENRRLMEDLQEVNDHYQELIAVSKEALKRKRNTDLQCADLKLTVYKRRRSACEKSGTSRSSQ